MGEERVQDIRQRLFALQDTDYRTFQARLLPTVPPERIIGVRTPALRQYAKELLQRGGTEDFLAALPHRYFDENQLHAFLIAAGKDYAETLAAVERFLPFVDNWATCDQLSPRVFRSHRAALTEPIARWLAAEQPYTVRFGIGMLLQHYLDEEFAPHCLEWVAAVQSEAYYVNMMRAWYFATALAKQWDAALPYLTQRRLDAWTHEKTIRKALESFRVTEEQKNVLRTLKTKK
ncbi:MAG: DNA alkylation repair protein [Oscillospiraceae bacterium]|nr:DNA alkylation repair protein [Oscillospiraceae bacterium]